MLDGNGPKFEKMVADLKSRGLNSVMFANNFAARDSSLLEVSDRSGIDVYMQPGGDLNLTWWHSDVPADLENARTAAKPIVQLLGTHPSLKGYVVKDEPDLDNSEKVSLITQAFHDLDPARSAAPILIGIDRVDPIFQAARPDTMLIDVYPIGYTNPPCDFTMTGFGYPLIDFVSYIRLVARNKPPSIPLWVILQTHSFQKSLREPLPAEVRAQFWMAIGEGAKGIFWFIYSSQQGWIGLADNPIIFSEVTSLTRRALPLRSLLLSLHKVQNQFEISGAGRQDLYISTLASDDHHLYIVAVNKDCEQSQNLIIHSSNTGGNLKDLETSNLVSFDSPVSLPPGDGKIFEYIKTLGDDEPKNK